MKPPSVAASRPRGYALVALVASAVLGAGCRASVDCSCAPVAGGVLLQAPTGVVQAIETSGAACGDAQIRCVPMDFSSELTPHCAQYQILPRRPGDCHIAVTTADGRNLQKDVATISEPGCCAGVVAADPAEADWIIGSGVDAATDS